MLPDLGEKGKKIHQGGECLLRNPLGRKKKLFTPSLQASNRSENKLKKGEFKMSIYYS